MNFHGAIFFCAVFCYIYTYRARCIYIRRAARSCAYEHGTRQFSQPKDAPPKPPSTAGSSGPPSRRPQRRSRRQPRDRKSRSSRRQPRARTRRQSRRASQARTRRQSRHRPRGRTPLNFSSVAMHPFLLKLASWQFSYAAGPCCRWVNPTPEAGGDFDNVRGTARRPRATAPPPEGQTTRRGRLLILRLLLRR